MARSKNEVASMKNMDALIGAIQQTNQQFLKHVQKQVNSAMTLRNWIIGYRIFEYEQEGEDRAQYGERLLQKLAERLKGAGVKGLSFTNLLLFRKFYRVYPQMVDVAGSFMQISDIQYNEIYQSVSDKFKRDSSQHKKIGQAVTDQFKGYSITPAETLLNKLSFSHFIELIKCDSTDKRHFYEIETINNNWSVRELQRAISSKLFERTGKAANKKTLQEGLESDTFHNPDTFIRNPYVLEFLGIEGQEPSSESQVEEAIINHLHSFLLEMGRGFCFEARQKRITFNNTHYRIDLVFYHRILKCHVLIELKLDKFTAADVGQMNMYLNYFKDNEMQENDNDPIGIILCTDKDETLVKYATAGLSQNLFISQYLSNLPSEKQLKDIIEEEQAKIQAK